MKQLRYILKTIAFSSILLLTAHGFSQTDRLIRAQQLYNSALPSLKKETSNDEKAKGIKIIETAKLAIDSVVQNTETKSDFVSWTLRAFIYNELFKFSDKLKLKSPLRDTIISSLKKSIQLKPDADYENNNKKLITNIAGNYYNIAAKSLDTLDDKLSEIAYKKHKETLLIIDAKTDFRTKDIEYYSAVGSAFSELFNKDKNNTQAFQTAKLAYLKVLELDQDNASANRNLGILFCNQATDLIQSLDYGADINQLDIIQENAIKLAKQAEQFMLKAYKADPKNQSTVLGLYYIYRILQNQPKMDEFSKKCKELGIKLDK